MRETQFVHRFPVFSPTLYPAVTTNVYLIVDQGEAVIIDAGYDDPSASQAILSYIQSLGGITVKALVLTHHHKDHSPGAKNLMTQLTCPVLCHPLEVESIEKQIHPYHVTSTVAEGDTIRVGKVLLRVLHTPGHTQGQLNIWLEEERLLFTGDNIVGQGTTWIGPPDGDLTDYLATLQRLRSMEPVMIAPGHGEMIRNPKERIEFFIQRRLEREQQIKDLLAERPRTVDELVATIYQGQLHPSVMWVAERTVMGHLEKLRKENQVQQISQYYHLL